MLRIVVIGLALAAPASVAPEQFPHSALHVRVIGDRGAELGRVTEVERNADGDIVAVKIPGLEPPDAPRPAQVASESSELVRRLQAIRAERVSPDDV